MADSNIDYTVKLGLLAEYATPAELMQAAEKFREAGYRRWDVYSPFPIHGMDDAMGLGNSKVGWFTFCCGASGYTLGMIMIWWMNAHDYAIGVGGKPLFSPIFSFPVAYECTILLGAFGSLGGMFILNKLPRHYNPLFKVERFSRATHDGFFLFVETSDPKYSDIETRKLLESTGTRQIEEVRD
ncbi:MAG TPA: DUF3341 domain-containing protein [Verrucomicrobiales bacterium]|nr:DUF3341 domain-containing protein [Verrucomicrobiales bacterium]